MELKGRKRLKVLWAYNSNSESIAREKSRTHIVTRHSETEFSGKTH